MGGAWRVLALQVLCRPQRSGRLVPRHPQKQWMARSGNCAPFSLFAFSGCRRMQASLMARGGRGGGGKGGESGESGEGRVTGA